MSNESNETINTDTQNAETRGRPPVVEAEIFAAVFNKAENLDQVVETFFPGLTGDEYAARKLYCSMRAAQLRRKNKSGKFDVAIKQFPRGRKPKTLIDIEVETDIEPSTQSEHIAAE